jgi:hypothetical protein
VSASEIRTLVSDVRLNVVRRRNGRGGVGAAENCIAALRCLYRRAEADGFLTEADNPALKVAKPRRLVSTRRALLDARLAEINEVVASTGDDPLDLDEIQIRSRSSAGRLQALTVSCTRQACGVPDGHRMIIVRRVDVGLIKRWPLRVFLDRFSRRPGRRN